RPTRIQRRAHGHRRPASGTGRGLQADPVPAKGQALIMAIVRFQDLMASAERGSYAVGYFESWNLESLLAVADAAEATRSPVILGFSGIYLPHPDRVAGDRLSTYAAMGLDVCRPLSVPACLLF